MTPPEPPPPSSSPPTTNNNNEKTNVQVSPISHQTSLLLLALQPTPSSNLARQEIADFIQALVKQSLSSSSSSSKAKTKDQDKEKDKDTDVEHFTVMTGSSALRTYLPISNLDLTVIVPSLLSTSSSLSAQEIFLKINETLTKSMLTPSPISNHHITKLRISPNPLLQLHVKVSDVNVTLNINDIESVLDFLLFEEVDVLIDQFVSTSTSKDEVGSKTHLLKRSIVLIQSWFVNESSRVTATGLPLLSTTASTSDSTSSQFSIRALQMMILHIFAVDDCLLCDADVSPLSVFYRFFEFYKDFDYEAFDCVFDLFSTDDDDDDDNDNDDVVKSKLFDGVKLIIDSIFESSPPLPTSTLPASIPLSSPLSIINPVALQSPNIILTSNLSKSGISSFKAALNSGFGELDFYSNWTESVSNEGEEPNQNWFTLSFFPVTCQLSSFFGSSNNDNKVIPSHTLRQLEDLDSSLIGQTSTSLHVNIKEKGLEETWIKVKELKRRVLEQFESSRNVNDLALRLNALGDLSGMITADSLGKRRVSKEESRQGVEELKVILGIKEDLNNGKGNNGDEKKNDNKKAQPAINKMTMPKRKKDVTIIEEEKKSCGGNDRNTHTPVPLSRNSSGGGSGRKSRSRSNSSESLRYVPGGGGGGVVKTANVSCQTDRFAEYSKNTAAAQIVAPPSPIPKAKVTTASNSMQTDTVTTRSCSTSTIATESSNPPPPPPASASPISKISLTIILLLLAIILKIYPSSPTSLPPLQSPPSIKLPSNTSLKPNNPLSSTLSSTSTSIASQDPPQWLTLGSNLTIGYLSLSPLSSSSSSTSSSSSSYSWLKDSTPLQNEHESSLQITNGTSHSSGLYTCIYKRGTPPTIWSTLDFNIQLTLPPTVTNRPGYYSVPLSSPLLLSVTATGKPEPKYQWVLNGIDIPGARSEKYRVERVGKEDGGTYTCRVWNVGGVRLWEEAIVEVL